MNEQIEEWEICPRCKSENSITDISTAEQITKCKDCGFIGKREEFLKHTNE